MVDDPSRDPSPCESAACSERLNLGPLLARADTSLKNNVAMIAIMENRNETMLLLSNVDSACRLFDVMKVDKDHNRTMMFVMFAEVADRVLVTIVLLYSMQYFLHVASKKNCNRNLAKFLFFRTLR